MKRVRFHVDLTVHNIDEDDYKRCALILENAIRRISEGHLAPGMDLARSTFYLANAKVLYKKPKVLDK